MHGFLEWNYRKEIWGYFLLLGSKAQISTHSILVIVSLQSNDKNFFQIFHFLLHLYMEFTSMHLKCFLWIFSVCSGHFQHSKCILSKICVSLWNLHVLWCSEQIIWAFERITANPLRKTLLKVPTESLRTQHECFDCVISAKSMRRGENTYDYLLHGLSVNFKHM